MRRTPRSTQGLENFTDIVTRRWWNRSYVLNLPWLIIHFKKQKILQRILIGPRLSQHSIQNVQDPKLLGLQRKRKMWSILKGKNNQEMPTKMNQMLEWSVRDLYSNYYNCAPWNEGKHYWKKWNTNYKQELSGNFRIEKNYLK